MYIHEHKNWTEFRWDSLAVLNLLGEVRNLQGRLLGKMEGLGFPLQNEATLSTLTHEVVKSSEIEGEKLNEEQVRSSLAMRLGMELPNTVASIPNIDAVVDMMIDATGHHKEILSKKRLIQWHTGLFQNGYNTLYRVDIGKYRTGEMQVVSGPMGRQKIHFVAPPPHSVSREMQTFLEWFNHYNTIDSVLKSAIAHFWFVTIHPFDDGNGRIARAIAEMQLARSDNSALRFYSMSKQILKERKEYYQQLESAQRGSGDITEWIIWFLNCLKRSLQTSEELLQNVLHKKKFWEEITSTPLNERQRKMINKLLDGFEGKLTTTKWAKIAKTSQDTALRDINDLISKGVLVKDTQGGRSTGYTLKVRSK